MTTRRSPRFYRLVGAFATTRLVTRVHPVLYRRLGARGILGRNLGVQNVIVETTGWKTGKAREAPLYAFPDGDRLVVIGSNGGHGTLPAWIGNLRADPRARVRGERDVRAVRAYEAQGDERGRLWQLVNDGYPGYDLYQEVTAYPIPVVVLEPARSEG